MITIEKNRSWTAVAIVAAVAVAGGLAWWAFAPQGASGDAGAPGAAGSMWQQWSSASGAASGDVPSTSILSDARWGNVNTEDQNTLEASLSKAPNAKAEAARILSYVQYHRAFEAWQGLDEQKQARERRQLAEGLFKELPDRLKTGEFTLMEAALMGAVLIAEAEPDEARRTQRVEAWQSQLATIVPNPEDETRMAAQNRETEYMRRRATAFGEWQNQTDASLRTPAKLAQAMAEIDRAYAAGQ